MTIPSTHWLAFSDLETDPADDLFVRIASDNGDSATDYKVQISSLIFDASQIGGGVFPDGRISGTSVAQHAGVIDHNALLNYDGLEHYPAIDEDDMASNSPNHVPTQQSVKAYVDASVIDPGEVKMQVVTSVAATMTVNLAYVPNHASVQVELTLPPESVVGDHLEVLGLGLGGWAVWSNASAAAQKIILHKAGGDEESEVSAYSGQRLVESDDVWDCLRLVCTSTDGPIVWESVENHSGVVYTSPTPPTPPAGDRAIFGGGYNAVSKTTIDYVAIASTGDAGGFGDLTLSRSNIASCSSTTRGLFAGGASVSITKDTIDYVTFASAGNAVDFGDLTVARIHLAGCSSDTHGLFGGGEEAGFHDVIDYVVLASAGNAVDFGNLTEARFTLASCSSSTRGVFAGGATGPGGTNVVDYVTLASFADATDFGDLLSGILGLVGCSSSTRGVFSGGTGPTNVIQYIEIASTGNASDFGDLTGGRIYCGSSSSKTRGLIGGGYNGTTQVNIIDYVTIASIGNATDFGDLTLSRKYLASCSADHGGLA